jgi:hypothetical protein
MDPQPVLPWAKFYTNRQEVAGPHLGTSRSRLFIPCPHVIDKRAAALRLNAADDGLRVLRGIVLKANRSMYLTMSKIHEHHDYSCPLKESLIRIKQSLLCCSPNFARKLNSNGSRWGIRVSQIERIPIDDHAPSLAKSLRELVTAHDYLKSQQRLDATLTACEVYENVDALVALASLPSVQRCLE